MLISRAIGLSGLDAASTSSRYCAISNTPGIVGAGFWILRQFQEGRIVGVENEIGAVIHLGQEIEADRRMRRRCDVGIDHRGALWPAHIRQTACRSKGS